MNHDVNHFGLSGGKDSTALLGWALHESGYDPASLRFSFCDTENEYQEVYDQIDRLDEIVQKHGCPPIARLRSMGFLDLCIKKQRFPGAKSRFCTDVLKITPSHNYVLAFVWLDGKSVLLHTGVRADESTERSLLDEYGVSDNNALPIRRPLLKWTISDVWEAHRKWKLPVNALYATGRKRVGCRLCCMSNKQDIRTTAKTRPWVIDLYRDWERIVGQTSKVKGSLHIQSFFPADKAPEQYRSIKGQTRQRDSQKGKKGESYSVATIDDIVEWSKTLRGGKEVGFDFMYEEDDAHAPCKMGYCE